MITINSLREELEEAVREDIKYYLSNDQDTSDLQDVAYEALHNAMDNMCTYTSTCKEIIDATGIDIFSDDNELGEQPTSWGQSAYLGLMEIFVDTEAIMEEELENYKNL